MEIHHVKIFLSHQKHDSEVALEVKIRLKINHNIDCYLDIIDPAIKIGEDLANHVRNELNQCTQLLAIVSEATMLSWWVPWEIGVATEKDYPLATFGKNVELPEYLRKWPYMKNMADLDKYAEVSKEAQKRVVNVDMQSISSNSITYRNEATEYFYKTLRARLGQ
jgi:hypothetical protein